MRKKYGLLALLLAAAMTFTACGGGGKEDKPADNDAAQEETAGVEGDTIKIGALAPLTGPVALYGVSTTNGAKMAVEEINEAGGINGKMIEYIVYDEKGDATEAVTAYDRLVDDGVVALIGDVTSGPTNAVAEVAKEDNMPMITPTGTQADITIDRPNVFRVCITDPQQGTVLGTFAKDNLQAGTAAILANNSSDYSKGIADTFKAQAESLGIEIVAEEGYGDNDNDFRSQLTNIASANPDVIIVPDYYEKVALIAPQAREMGITATLIGGDGWDGVIASMDASNFASVEGAFYTNHYSIDDTTEVVANFINKYKETYNEDTTAFAALGYDAVYVMADAIKRADSTDPQAIIDALNTTDYSGVTGSLKFDENGDPIKEVTIIKIIDGAYTFDSKVSLAQ